MDAALQNDLEQLPELLAGAWQLSVEYLEELPSHPVSVQAPVIQWPPLPDEGMGALAVQNLFEEVFLPYIVASSGPRYWGFVTGGGTPAAIAGDWLASVYDQNTQSTSGAGDCSALLELQTVNLLLRFFGLPADYNGGFVSGATMANFSGMAVARQWFGRQKGIDIAGDGLRSPIPVYTATAHSSSLKALAMLGMGSRNIHYVPCLEGREAIDITALQQMLPADKNEPFILLASAGTVNSVDYDDFKALAAIRQQYNCWLHVDAAFGAFAACSPAHAHLLEGWELADSITIDFHKWMNVPYDSAIILTKKVHAVLQTETFQNSSAPYLANLAGQFSYLNFVPENSRRFRALPVWFTLMAYGKQGYRWIVENNIRLANELANGLVASGFFDLAAPVRLNTVCFAIKEEFAGQLTIPVLLDELNRRGSVFMTPSAINGRPCVRAALVNYRTSGQDIEKALIEITDAAASLTVLKTKNTRH